jgi:hypothetical protein
MALALCAVVCSVALVDTADARCRRRRCSRCYVPCSAPVARVVKVNLKCPRDVCVRPGDFIQLYWDYYVIPEDIVDDLPTDIGDCEALSKIGVDDTGQGLLGASQISSLLYAKKCGSCEVTVTVKKQNPPPPIKIKVVVR